MFIITCPTAAIWLAIIRTQRALLLNPRPQMLALLKEVRADVDNQFDENQSKWKPLRPYTVNKKKQMDADMRILHETREGQGLRLRDAYAAAGTVTPAGRIIYNYPESKPYAQEHQEGKIDVKLDIAKPKKKRKRKSNLQKWNDQLDDEYFDRFG